MRRFVVLTSLAFAGFGLSNPAAAAVQSCVAGSGANVAAVAQTTPIAVVAHWQPAGVMQKILSQTVTVGGLPLIRSCMVAHFSTMARITDNYVAFRVTVDGVAMTGHASGLAGIAQPTVWTSLSDNNEQLTDPIKTVSHNFFANVTPGVHVVDVWAAAGSGIAVPPTVYNPVLTLEYR